MVLTSFLLFMLLFLIIGVASVTHSRRTTEDYLIAGKSVSPLFVGLSAIATNNSGFMFIGMVGYTYTYGLSSIWLMFGWITGDLIASLLTVRRIQAVSRDNKICSFGDLLSRWHGDDHRYLRLLVGLVTLFFLTVYAAAQFKAGSKAAASLLGWDPATGILISALIVLAYSTVGGIRASIWTDVAQSLVMIIGMFTLLYAGLELQGGIAFVLQKLEAVGPGYMSLFPERSGFGVLLFIVGWIFGGISVIGQPHIVIRFMSLDNHNHVTRMRVYYYTWFTLFYGFTIVVGLLSRLIISKNTGFDAEVALPVMAQALLDPWFVGLVLAAMFAATMSTADSLILSCSAALSRDILPEAPRTLRATKLGTWLVLISAVAIALGGNRTVFSLVLDAWGMLASAFAPLLIVYSTGGRVNEKLALGMLITGMSAFAAWQHAGLDGTVYAAAPGIISGLLLYQFFSRRTLYRTAN
jgi:SSS family transporter